MRELYREYFTVVHPTINIDIDKYLYNVSSLPLYSIIPILSNGKRVGFIDGYALSYNTNTFRLLNVYKGSASSIAVKRAFDEFERYIIRLGFTGWYSLVHKDTQSLVKKLGAKEIKEWEQEQQ